MNRDSFQSRLERAKNKGKLSTADLSIWFARPYHTVRGWLVPRSDRKRGEGYEPWGPQADNAHRLLDTLEQVIRLDVSLPVPDTLSPLERQAYIKKIRRQYVRQVKHDYYSRLSETRSAG